MIVILSVLVLGAIIVFVFADVLVALVLADILFIAVGHTTILLPDNLTIPPSDHPTNRPTDQLASNQTVNWPNGQWTSRPSG